MLLLGQLLLLELGLLPVVVGVLVLENINLFELIFLLGFPLLDRALVQEPLGEEVDWVLRLLLVDDGESLGDDGPDIGLHDVGSVRVKLIPVDMWRERHALYLEFKIK